MKIILWTIISFLVPYHLYSNTIYLRSQDQVDNFNFNYPDISSVDVLDIGGKNIINLDSLYKIDCINDFLIINETNIQSLQSFQHIKFNGGSCNYLSIILSGNDQLESLEGLENMRFYWVQIHNNPNLVNCGINSICSHILTEANYTFYQNPIDCNNPLKILEQCSHEPNLEGNICKIENFEEMNSNLNYQDLLFYMDTSSIRTHEITPNLSEGSNALTLRSNRPFVEGVLDSEFYYNIESIKDTFSLVFDYQCKGHGFCGLYLNDSIVQPNWDRQLWLVEAGEQDIYQVRIDNIALAENTINPESLIFRASPYWTDLGSFGVAEFTIDNLKIICKSDKLPDFKENELFLFPNPTQDYVYIKNAEIGNVIRVLNISGDILIEERFTGIINLEALNQGYYVIQIFNEEGVQKTAPLIKI